MGIESRISGHALTAVFVARGCHAGSQDVTPAIKPPPVSRKTLAVAVGGRVLVTPDWLIANTGSAKYCAAGALGRRVEAPDRFFQDP